MIIRPESFEKNSAGREIFDSIKLVLQEKIFYRRYIIPSSLARSFIYYTDKLSVKFFGQFWCEIIDNHAIRSIFICFDKIKRSETPFNQLVSSCQNRSYVFTLSQQGLRWRNFWKKTIKEFRFWPDLKAKLSKTDHRGNFETLFHNKLLTAPGKKGTTNGIKRLLLICNYIKHGIKE